jgi:hypothetical protein
MKLPLVVVAIGLLGFGHSCPGNGGSRAGLAIGLLLCAGGLDPEERNSARQSPRGQS